QRECRTVCKQEQSGSRPPEGGRTGGGWMVSFGHLLAVPNSKLHHMNNDDERFMSRALELAAAQLGKTAPNPSVGCVIVRDGVIVGEGATGAGGRPHAEETALKAAGDKARDACAYVTLEPCSQRSAGALSCSQHLVGAGIKRVVIACEDPHPLAAHGISRL